jgi:hypothetical protein
MDEGAIKLSEALKSNSSLASLALYCNLFVAYWFHFILTYTNTGNRIHNEGAIKLAEALKLNSSLTILPLACNKPVGSFHSHSFQLIISIVSYGHKLQSVSNKTKSCGKRFMTALEPMP